MLFRSLLDGFFLIPIALLSDATAPLGRVSRVSSNQFASQGVSRARIRRYLLGGRYAHSTRAIKWPLLDRQILIRYSYFSPFFGCH